MLPCMGMDLAQFFRATDGCRNIPRNLRPSVTDNISRSLRGSERLVALGTLPDGATFHIYQQRTGQDAWMEIFREDGTLQERQEYHPAARAYTHGILSFDATGTKIACYNAYAHDGRLVEEVTRDDNQQLARTIHQYPDLRAAI